MRIRHFGFLANRRRTTLLPLCFPLLGALAGLFFLAGPYVSFTPALGGMIVLFAGLAVLGLFTGAGLLRLKNWARTSALIFAWIIVVVSALTLLYEIVMRPTGLPGMALFVSFLSFESVPLGCYF